MPQSKEARRLPFAWATLLIPAGAFAVAVGSMVFHYSSKDDAPSQPAVAADVIDVTPLDTDPPAEALADALSPAEEPPPLIEILQAADLLVQAGVIEPPPPAPTMREVLLAADELLRAGFIEAPPEPTMLEILQSADALVRAGVIAAPQPSLMEVLLAADELRKAGALPREALAQAPEQAPPPASPIEAPAAPPPPAQPAAEPPPAPVATGNAWFDAGFEAEVMAVVNARRAEAGLGSVTFESRLTTAGQRYAKVLADNNWFSHTGPDGSSLVDRVTGAGFPFDVAIGEVIAWGTDVWPAADVVQAWMDSPPHREQILTGEYRRAGVGCYFTVDGAGLQSVRCVMDFAG